MADVPGPVAPVWSPGRADPHRDDVTAQGVGELQGEAGAVVLA